MLMAEKEDMQSSPTSSSSGKKKEEVIKVLLRQLHMMEEDDDEDVRRVQYFQQTSSSSVVYLKSDDHQEKKTKTRRREVDTKSKKVVKVRTETGGGEDYEREDLDREVESSEPSSNGSTATMSQEAESTPTMIRESTRVIPSSDAEIVTTATTSRTRREQSLREDSIDLGIMSTRFPEDEAEDSQLHDVPHHPSEQFIEDCGMRALMMMKSSSIKGIRGGDTGQKDRDHKKSSKGRRGEQKLTDQKSRSISHQPLIISSSSSVVTSGTLLDPAAADVIASHQMRPSDQASKGIRSSLRLEGETGTSTSDPASAAGPPGVASSDPSSSGIMMHHQGTPVPQHQQSSSASLSLFNVPSAGDRRRSSLTVESCWGIRSAGESENHYYSRRRGSSGGVENVTTGSGAAAASGSITLSSSINNHHNNSHQQRNIASAVASGYPGTSSERSSSSIVSGSRRRSSSSIRFADDTDTGTDILMITEEDLADILDDPVYGSDYMTSYSRQSGHHRLSSPFWDEDNLMATPAGLQHVTTDPSQLIESSSASGGEEPYWRPATPPATHLVSSDVIRATTPILPPSISPHQMVSPFINYSHSLYKPRVLHPVGGVDSPESTSTSSIPTVGGIQHHHPSHHHPSHHTHPKRRSSSLIASSVSNRLHLLHGIYGMSVGGAGSYGRRARHPSEPSSKTMRGGGDRGEEREEERVPDPVLMAKRRKDRESASKLLLTLRRRKSLSRSIHVIDPIALLDYSYSRVILNRFLKSSIQWKFSSFTLDTMTGGHPLSELLAHLFDYYDLISYFKLDMINLWKLFKLFEQGYHDTNPYHNSVHAADVTQAMHCFLAERSLGPYLSRMEIMCALLSAVSHDLDHPGVNQHFLISTNSHLAALYNNLSVLESHHWRFAISCLRESHVFDHFPPDDWIQVKFLLKSLILATDITQQASYLAQFRMTLASMFHVTSTLDDQEMIMQQHHQPLQQEFSLLSSTKQEIPDDHKDVLKSDTATTTITETKSTKVMTCEEIIREKRISVMMSLPENRLFILKIALKCADLGNPCRPWFLSKKWSEQIISEFYRQGDFERQLHLPITPICNRYEASMAKIQCGECHFY